MNLGKVLKTYRLHNEISLRELGLIIGVSSSTLSRIENGNFKPDLVTFNKIINWLCADKEQPQMDSARRSERG